MLSLNLPASAQDAAHGYVYAIDAQIRVFRCAYSQISLPGLEMENLPAKEGV